jgi:hypothetical protein
MATITQQQHECTQCGTSFTSRNPNAQFCSDRCKQSAYRSRKQEESSADKLKDPKQQQKPVSEKPESYGRYNREERPVYDEDGYNIWYDDEEDELTEDELHEREQQKLPWWKRDTPKGKKHQPKSEYAFYEKPAIKQLDENITDWIGRLIKMSKRKKVFFKHIEFLVEEMEEYAKSYDYEKVPDKYPLKGYLERAMIPPLKKFVVLCRANGGCYGEVNLDDEKLEEFEEILMIAAE